MKFLLRNILLFTLAAAVLFSASGVTVFKMVCCKKNKTEVSLDKFKSCCKHKSTPGTFVSKKCCDYSTQTIKIEQIYKTDNSTFSFLPVFHSLFTTLHSLYSCFLKISLSAFDSSPPLSGILILISISTLLI